MAANINLAALKANWILIALLAVVLRFAFRVAQEALVLPPLLPVDTFVLPAEALWPFGAAVLASLALLTYATPRWASGRFAATVRAHGPGILLALISFAAFLILANVFNRTDFNMNNVFFAADTHQWQLRLSSPTGHLMEMRAIHPLAFLFLRPVVMLVNFVLGASPFAASLFLIATLGAAQVYLVWWLVRTVSQNAIYASLFAALFGLSSAHLLFSSLIETYVFSAFALVLFVALLYSGSYTWAVVFASLLGFGVNLANLAQNAISSFVTLGWRKAALLSIAVITLAFGLSFVNRSLFPDSGYFFDPAAYGVETQHFQEETPAQPVAARTNILSRDVFVYNIVAPQPFLVATNRDARGEFPKFYSMLGDRPAALVGTGRYAAWLWGGLLAAALISLTVSLRKEKFSQPNRLGLALLGCVLFNFAFHFFYGFEPFLYTADWTYALVLFVAVGLRPLAQNKWLQVALLLLVALLTLNNLSFLSFLMSGIQPYIAALN